MDRRAERNGFAAEVIPDLPGRPLLQGQLRHPRSGWLLERADEVQMVQTARVARQDTRQHQGLYGRGRHRRCDHEESGVEKSAADVLYRSRYAAAWCLYGHDRYRAEADLLHRPGVPHRIAADEAEAEGCGSEKEEEITLARCRGGRIQTDGWMTFTPVSTAIIRPRLRVMARRLGAWSGIPLPPRSCGSFNS